ncbi:hypothetical protein CDIK_0222 [Cucumispora dikerogammari]|nr:hypothetical protein CDIK_0222 [Cucumispora dikerogammari]
MVFKPVHYHSALMDSSLIYSFNHKRNNIHVGCIFLINKNRYEKANKIVECLFSLVHKAMKIRFSLKLIYTKEKLRNLIFEIKAFKLSTNKTAFEIVKEGKFLKKTFFAEKLKVNTPCYKYIGNVSYLRSNLEFIKNNSKQVDDH